MELLCCYFGYICYTFCLSFFVLMWVYGHFIPWKWDQIWLQVKDHHWKVDALTSENDRITSLWFSTALASSGMEGEGYGTFFKASDLATPSWWRWPLWFHVSQLKEKSVRLLAYQAGCDRDKAPNRQKGAHLSTERPFTHVRAKKPSKRDNLSTWGDSDRTDWAMNKNLVLTERWQYLQKLNK